MFLFHKKESVRSQSLASFLENHLWKVLLFVPLSMVLGHFFVLPIFDWYYEISIAEILILFTLLTWGANVLSREGRKDLILPSIGTLLLVLFCLMIISLFWVESIEKWIIALRVIFFQISTFFLTVNLINTKERAHNALKWFIGFAVLGALAILTTVIPIPYSELVTINRAWIITPLGALSYAAAMIALCAPLVLGIYYLAQKNWEKVIAASTYIAIVISLLYAAGKAAMLSAFAGALFMFIRVKEKRWHIPFLTMIGFALFIVLSTSVQGGEAGSYTLQRIRETTIDNSTQFRLLELNAARSIIQDHLLLGMGWGNLKVGYLRETGFYEGDANNIFIHVIGELGLIGLFVFTFLVVEFLYMLKWKKSSLVKKMPILPILFGAFFITAGINAMFEVTIIGLFYGILFWYLVGVFYTLREVK